MTEPKHAMVDALKNAPPKGSKRTNFAKSQKLIWTPKMEAAWEAIQGHCEPEKPDDPNAQQGGRMFTHHADPERTLFIDVDASEQFGIGAMIYHVEGDPAPILCPVERA